MHTCKLFCDLRKAGVVLAKKYFSLSRPLARIQHDKEQNRFVMSLPSDSAFVEYNSSNGVLNLNFIFVPRRYRTIGIGQDLAREVLDYCASNDIKVILSCPYLVTFYKQHPYPQFKKVVRGVAVPKHK